MFFARIITKDTPFIYNEEPSEEPLGDVITISNLTLAPSSKDSASVYFKKDGQEFLICNLTHKNPHVPVNLYIEIGENLTILVKGNGVVHVIGFFEPEPKIEHLDEVELHHKHECQHNHRDHHHHHDESAEEAAVEPTKSSPKALKEVKSPQTKPIEKSFSLEEEVESAEINDDSDDSDESEEEDESEEINESEENDLKGLNDLDDDIGEEKPRKQKNSHENNGQKNKQSNQNFNPQENFISNKKQKDSHNQPNAENQKSETKNQYSQNRNGNGNEEKNQNKNQNLQGKNKSKQKVITK